MKLITDFFKGAVIGIANIIPGLSGGTMALIMGIYEQLTDAIGNLLTDKEKRKVYLLFLGTILIGAVAGILLFAGLFTWLLSTPIKQQHTYFFITGLITGSIPFIFRLNKDMKINGNRLLLMLLGLCIVIFFSLFADKENVVYFPEIRRTILGFINITDFHLGYNLWLIVCGIITAVSMVLPGVSGSALLVSLGEYSNILSIVDRMLVIPGAFFGIGVVFGIVLCAKVVSILLKKYTIQTYFFIIGLMLASIYQIWLELQESINLTPHVLIVSIILGYIGFLVAYYTSKINN
ncbi:putative membrane protein [Natranaerovirga pectinivora]|uniref:Putative membrane protein n=1 Tax=Natranaerovirga pectinivora TaxID=682400 RepID=A0A4R3MI77_9FIRM|nr:DUF368 domain-containing protein [Natranaerovirga pectinivora]TCT12985.1 putative membrane protein [Natranaerovirga pectinivora]